MLGLDLAQHTGIFTDHKQDVSIRHKQGVSTRHCQDIAMHLAVNAQTIEKIATRDEPSTAMSLTNSKRPRVRLLRRTRG